MKDTPRDYANLTKIAKKLSIVPYKNRWGIVSDGQYTLEGFVAPVDLSACAEDEVSILRTAIKQLSEQVDESYNVGIENDFME